MFGKVRRLKSSGAQRTGAGGGLCKRHMCTRTHAHVTGACNKGKGRGDRAVSCTHSDCVVLRDARASAGGRRRARSAVTACTSCDAPARHRHRGCTLWGREIDGHEIDGPETDPRWARSLILGHYWNVDPRWTRDGPEMDRFGSVF